MFYLPMNALVGTALPTVRNPPCKSKQPMTKQQQQQHKQHLWHKIAQKSCDTSTAREEREVVAAIDFSLNERRELVAD